MFDPNTGKPMQGQKFDPMTGQPIAQSTAPLVGAPPQYQAQPDNRMTQEQMNQQV